ncbi:hypothetical protein HMPREF3155_06395 [Corynebacterium sp. HMSC06D04]|uniref:hypothetical protein n=1 Tax=Corynebacterium sp. HMSC06D04 TaxID=1581123 RepID=UPI0008A1C163|nr:hypothetical protein [Corynebacterium sp. HMSC06D04]OFT51086.1 hypothetical protein HMPREF3155_06395 [Corynebacterium sp. HMSC06D04]
MENKQNSDDVLEALNFETQVNARASRKQTFLYFLIAIFGAGSIVAMNLLPKGAPLAAFLVVFLVVICAIAIVVERKKKTRPALRQDPLNQPKADRRYMLGVFIMLSPMLFNPFIKGNVVAVVVVAAAWACGAFWALQSGALDLQKRAVGNA